MTTEQFYKGKNIVITGGSSGIGYAIAEEFARQQANICLLARDGDRLTTSRQQLSHDFNKIKVESYSVDVRDEKGVKDVVDHIGMTSGIDVLINSAGISHCGLMSDSTLAQSRSIMDVNYMGSVNMVHFCWPYLMASKGHIAFINSVAGYLGIIGYGNYCASKFAITGLAESLRLEARDCGINLTVIFPPDTDTPMLANENKIPDTEALSKLGSVWKPEKVARRLVRKMMRKQFEVYCGSGNKFFLLLKILMPGVYYGISDYVIKKDRQNRRK